MVQLRSSSAAPSVTEWLPDSAVLTNGALGAAGLSVGPGGDWTRTKSGGAAPPVNRGAELPRL